MTIIYADDLVTVHHGDALEVFPALPDASVHSVVTDPPYGLEFMGREWDGVDGFRRSLGPVGKVTGIGTADGTPARRGTGTPAWGASGNPPCRNCGGTKYDRTRPNGCACDAPEFPNHMADQMRIFQRWCQAWAVECLRVLKPGGHLLAFGGTRTVHRLTCAIEDAGFEIRDGIDWIYASGFPKSLDVSKAIDKAAGAERTVVGVGRAGMSSLERTRRVEMGHRPGLTAVTPEAYPITAPATDDARDWSGWGTALKPAREPIVVARKPLAGTVAANVLTYGTGALHIDACRTTAGQDYRDKCASVVGLDSNRNGDAYGEYARTREDSAHPGGRWPTNAVFGCGCPDRCLPGCPVGDLGDNARYFPVFRYEAKAPAAERPRVDGIAHPTVKPLDLMRWLVRLVTPPGGTVLDPLAGSGTTAEACTVEGFRCIAIEREADYLPLIAARLAKPLQPTLGPPGLP